MFVVATMNISGADNSPLRFPSVDSFYGDGFEGVAVSFSI